MWREHTLQMNSPGPLPSKTNTYIYTHTHARSNRPLWQRGFSLTPFIPKPRTRIRTHTYYGCANIIFQSFYYKSAIFVVRTHIYIYIGAYWSIRVYSRVSPRTPPTCTSDVLIYIYIYIDIHIRIIIYTLRLFFFIFLYFLLRYPDDILLGNEIARDPFSVTYCLRAYRRLTGNHPPSKQPPGGLVPRTNDPTHSSRAIPLATPTLSVSILYPQVYNIIVLS